MLINNIQKITRGDRTRISALYTWEDCNRPQAEVYFETDSEFAEDLTPNANAFLLAGVMPAMLHGERRVCIDGQVCPELRNGLVTAMQQLQEWHGKEVCQPIAIEATQGFVPGIPRNPGRAASFQSGGVDAMATLRSNRLDFPLEHPASIKDCLMIHGFDMGAYESLDENLEAFEFAKNRLCKLGQSEHFTLIPVYTNMLHLDDDDYNQYWFYFGSVLAAVAHAFVPRISTVHISSGDSLLGGMTPGGSHPLLDPNFGSADLRIVHDGIRFSRLDKVALIAQWYGALQNLRVCWDAFRAADCLNCGHCEKCLRTMCELLVFDKLKSCPAFPFDDISPEQLKDLRAGDIDFSAPRKEMLKVAILTLSIGNTKSWENLAPELEKIGRHDLVEVIQLKLQEYEQYENRQRENTLRRKIVRLDNRLLNGLLRKVYRKIRSR